MSDIKLFRVAGGSAEELIGSSAALEKTLQKQMEAHLHSLLGVHFLGSEYSTGKKHGGRIDTLGIDENGVPVIIEYKRSINENVINQGLFYLDWLLDHQAEFKLLVMEKLGKDAKVDISWENTRLLCIAGDFTRYDVHAVEQINRNIELIRYRRYGDEFLLLELINAVSAASPGTEKLTSTGAETLTGGGSGKSNDHYKSLSNKLKSASSELQDLFADLQAFALALGDEVIFKELRYYFAFRRLKNFLCVDLRSDKGNLLLYVKVNPDDVQLREGFSRDVREIGHWGTGDLELTISNAKDWEEAQPLVQKSFEAS